MTKSQIPLSTQAREIRRHNILELLSTGCTNHRTISDKLNIPLRMVYRDVHYLTEVSDEEMRYHFKSLPLEIKKAMTLIDLTIKMLTDIIDTESENRLEASRDRMQALKFKMELLDGKARLREVFQFVDVTNKKKTLDVTGNKQNIEVLKEDAIPEHA